MKWGPIVIITSDDQHRHRAKSGYREKGESTRTRLIRAGRDVFAERGYEGTSLKRVAEHLGVSRGTTYHHFGAKLELFVAVLDDVNTTVLDPCIAAAEARRTAPEQLRELLRPIPSDDIDKRSGIDFLVAAAVDGQRRSDLGVHVCARLTRLRLFLTSLLETGIGAGRAPGDLGGVSVELMMSILWSWALTSGDGAIDPHVSAAGAQTT